MQVRDKLKVFQLPRDTLTDDNYASSQEGPTPFLVSPCC
jgi:hypothetical protein